MEKKVFRSRISVLLIGIIFLILLNGFLQAILYKNYGGLYITGGVFVFILLIFTGMRYEISDGMLSVRMWFFTTGSVDIMNIVSVERTYNPLSSAAASLKRLYIYFNNTMSFPFWLISPKREQEFIILRSPVDLFSPPNISIVGTIFLFLFSVFRCPIKSLRNRKF